MTGPTPAGLADQAAEAVRALNHATIGGTGLVHPADAYDVLGALALLAARLPQALGQVQNFLDDATEAGRVSIVDGEHAGDPVAAVTTCAHHLDAAILAARRLHDALEAAAASVCWAAATDPGS
jgi:hypothetical protein